MFLIIVILAIAFVLVAIQQLRGLSDTRQQLSNFGIPQALIAPISLLLPILELMVALGLFVSITRTIALVTSIILLLLISLMIIIALGRGKQFEYTGFAQLQSQTLGYHNLVRNALLIVAALAIWWLNTNQSTFSIFSLSFIIPVAIIGVGLVIISQSWLIMRLSERYEELNDRIHELEQYLGLETQDEQTDKPSPVPALKPWQDQALILLFWAPDCGYCQPLPQIAQQAQQASHSPYRSIIINSGQPVSSIPNNQLPLVFDADRQIAKHYGIAGVPAAIMLDAQHQPISPPALGASAVQQLILTSFPATNAAMLVEGIESR